MHTAATGSVSWFSVEEKLTAFLELELAFQIAELA